MLLLCAPAHIHIIDALDIKRICRYLNKMLAEEEFPHVDVFICCFTEPVEVVEPTIIAAVNMNYPGEPLQDGKIFRIKATQQLAG